MNKNPSIPEGQQEFSHRIVFTEYSEPKLIIDHEGTILDANDAFCRRFNKKYGECIGTNLYCFFPPDVAAKRKHHAEEVYRTGKTLLFEDEINGRFCRYSMYPVAEGPDKTEVHCILIEDITYIKRDISKCCVLKNLSGK